MIMIIIWYHDDNNSYYYINRYWRYGRMTAREQIRCCHKCGCGGVSFSLTLSQAVKHLWRLAWNLSIVQTIAMNCHRHCHYHKMTELTWDGAPKGAEFLRNLYWVPMQISRSVMVTLWKTVCVFPGILWKESWCMLLKFACKQHRLMLSADRETMQTEEADINISTGRTVNSETGEGWFYHAILKVQLLNLHVSSAVGQLLQWLHSKPLLDDIVADNICKKINRIWS